MLQNTRPKWGAAVVKLIAALSSYLYRPWRPASESADRGVDFSWMLLLHDGRRDRRQFGHKSYCLKAASGFIGTSVYDPRLIAVLIAARILIGLGAFFALREAARNLCKTRLPQADGWWSYCVDRRYGRSHFPARTHRRTTFIPRARSCCW